MSVVSPQQSSAASTCEYKSRAFDEDDQLQTWESSGSYRRGVVHNARDSNDSCEEKGANRIRHLRRRILTFAGNGKKNFPSEDEDKLARRAVVNNARDSNDSCEEKGALHMRRTRRRTSTLAANGRQSFPSEEEDKQKTNAASANNDGCDDEVRIRSKKRQSKSAFLSRDSLLQFTHNADIKERRAVFRLGRQYYTDAVDDFIDATSVSQSRLGTAIRAIRKAVRHHMMASRVLETFREIQSSRLETRQRLRANVQEACSAIEASRDLRFRTLNDEDVPEILLGLCVTFNSTSDVTSEEMSRVVNILKKCYLDLQYLHETCISERRPLASLEAILKAQRKRVSFSEVPDAQNELNQMQRALEKYVDENPPRVQDKDISGESGRGDQRHERRDSTVKSFATIQSHINKHKSERCWLMLRAVAAVGAVSLTTSEEKSGPSLSKHLKRLIGAAPLCDDEAEEGNSDAGVRHKDLLALELAEYEKRKKSRSRARPDDAASLQEDDSAESQSMSVCGSSEMRLRSKSSCEPTVHLSEEILGLEADQDQNIHTVMAGISKYNAQLPAHKRHERWRKVRTLISESKAQFFANRDQQPSLCKPAVDLSFCESVVHLSKEAQALKLLRPQHVAPVNAWITVGMPGLVQNVGSFYYEVKIGPGLEDPQFGWVTENFQAGPWNGNGVGDDAEGWAADGIRHKLWHNGDKSAEWPGTWKEGDVIGLAIDLHVGVMQFSVNGDWVEGVRFCCQTAQQNIYPAVSAKGNFIISLAPSAWQYSPPSGEYKAWSELGIYERPAAKTPTPTLPTAKAGISNSNPQTHAHRVQLPVAPPVSVSSFSMAIPSQTSPLSAKKQACSRPSVRRGSGERVLDKKVASKFFSEPQGSSPASADSSGFPLLPHPFMSPLSPKEWSLLLPQKASPSRLAEKDFVCLDYDGGSLLNVAKLAPSVRKKTSKRWLEKDESLEHFLQREDHGDSIPASSSPLAHNTSSSDRSVLPEADNLLYREIESETLEVCGSMVERSNLEPIAEDFLCRRQRMNSTKQKRGSMGQNDHDVGKRDMLASSPAPNKEVEGSHILRFDDLTIDDLPPEIAPRDRKDPGAFEGSAHGLEHSLFACLNSFMVSSETTGRPSYETAASYEQLRPRRRELQRPTPVTTTFMDRHVIPDVKRPDSRSTHSPSGSRSPTGRGSLRSSHESHSSYASRGFCTGRGSTDSSLASSSFRTFPVTAR